MVLLACLAILTRFWQSIESQGQLDLGIALTARRSRLYAWLMLAGLLLLSVVAPTIGAVRTMPKGLHLVAGRFAPELADTPIVMALVATVTLAAALTSLIRPRQFLLAIAVIAWAFPLGLLAVAARQAEITLLGNLPEWIHRLPLDWGRINNALDMLVWISVLAGRFLPVAWLLLSMVRRALPAGLIEQATIDGANRSQLLQRILLPILAPAVLAGWLICALLAATETAAATMLRPPGFDALSVSLLNQMHYGRDGDVVALCILLMLVAGVCAGVVAAGLQCFMSSRDIG